MPAKMWAMRIRTTGTTNFMRVMMSLIKAYSDQTLIGTNA
jgi:hypothetical protein